MLALSLIHKRRSFVGPSPDFFEFLVLQDIGINLHHAVCSADSQYSGSSAVQVGHSHHVTAGAVARIVTPILDLAEFDPICFID